MTKPLLLVTAIALIDAQGRILLAQRPQGKHMEHLWEFAGGKVADGETPEEAIIREVKEELALTLAREDLFPLTFASHTYENFHLLMPLYGCKSWQGEPRALEHQALAWVHPRDFKDYPMPPADGPLADFLVKTAF